MGFLTKKNPPLVGIDISTTAVKLLGLSRKGPTYRIDNFAYVPLPADAVSENSIASIEKVSQAVEQAIRLSRTKAKHASVAVPGSSVITKIISMPADLTDEEMASQIQVEADQYIPYALEEVYLDFQVIGPNPHNPETVDVLLVASRSENVDDHVAAIEGAGLKCQIVDVETYALETAYSLINPTVTAGGNDQTVAIVKIGSVSTTLNVLHNGSMIYTREQRFGGKQLTEEIQNRYGLAFEEAERAKQEGGLPDDYPLEVMEPFKGAISQQVGRLLQMFFSSSPYKKVDLLMLAGGTAALPGLEHLIETQTATPTQIANPLARMALSGNVQAQAVTRHTSSLTIACGLAMRNFDNATG
ncbi:MAG: pilus assembly protein PilM [Gammaproteobacteria bacterium]|nr:pilus assembly protein PilM [Gammaproteobacteria bacterium]